MIAILGYIAMVCLITSFIPQVIKSIKDGHSAGVSLGFIMLALVGFVLMWLYIYLTTPIIPVLLNYGFNSAMILVVLWYKLFPRKKVT